MTHPPCRKCLGTGVEPAKPEWTQPAEKKEPTGTNITTPKQELPGGTEAFRALIGACGDSLSDLGYSASTPPYYVLMAVMADWLNGRAA